MTDTTTDQTDRRLEKIRALLAQAESTNYPEEARTFTAKAHELMAQWAIDDAMLAGHREAQSTDVKVVRIDLAWGPYVSGHEDLLNKLARAMDCRALFTSFPYRDDRGKRKYRSYAEVFGFGQDIEFVQMLYTSLMLQAQSEYLTDDVQARLLAETSHPGHKIRWRNAFQMGFNNAVFSRLWSQRKTVVAATPGVGLVLADRTKLVEARIADMYPSLRKKQFGGGQGGGSGKSLGHAAGQRSDIGNPSVSNKRKALDS